MQGMGKSAIPEFIAEMLGIGENAPAAALGPDDLFGNFNGILKGKIFVVVNEPSSDREDHSAKLKNLITGKEIVINNKYGAQYVIKNYVNYVFTSNKPYITHMGNSSRREAIYKCPTFDQKDIFDRVSQMMAWARKDGGKGFSFVLNWYLNRDIAKFDPYAAAPKTKYKEQAIALSKTPTEDFAQELSQWVVDNCNGRAAFTANQLQILCERWGHDKNVKPQYVRKAMAAHGDVDPSKLIKHGGKPTRYTIFVVTPQGGGLSTIDNYTTLVRDTENALAREIGSESSY